MGDLATNIGIDDTSKGKDVINRNAFGLLLGRIGRHHNGGILASGCSIGWDVDSKIDFLRFVGFDGASRIFDSDPIRDFGVGGNI